MMRALARSGGMLRSSSRLAFSLFESPPRTLTVATVTTERCFEALIQVPSGAISFDGPAPYSVHALEETTGRPYGFLLALGGLKQPTPVPSPCPRFHLGSLQLAKHDDVLSSSPGNLSRLRHTHGNLLPWLDGEYAITSNIGETHAAGSDSCDKELAPFFPLSLTRMDPIIRVREATAAIHTIQKHGYLELHGSHVKVLDSAGCHARMLIAALDSGDATAAHWGATPEVKAAKLRLDKTMTELEGAVMLLQETYTPLSIRHAVHFRYTIGDVANQMNELVNSYDLMIQQFGSRQQRYLRCVGNQVVNKLARYACENPHDSPKAARRDTFDHITRHYLGSSKRLASFLDQYSHFPQGLLALEHMGMFRHHPQQVTLLSESAMLQPNGAFLSNAVEEEFEGDLGLLICVGEVVDGLVDLSKRLDEDLFVDI